MHGNTGFTGSFMLEYRMRLFVAVNFSDTVKKQLLEIQAQLRSQCTRGNFTRPENLHITLAFLGETPETKVASLLQVIEDAQALPEAAAEAVPFEVSFNHTGCFTHSHKELWWVGADENCPALNCLKAIHSKLIKRLLDANLSVDNRSFNPHITLGREIKHSEKITLNCNEIKIKVDHLSLMKSEHIGGILTYTELL
jgi:RNA 2',3'-cyclic 3'-phosphodiesterase